jgi:protein-disulfide isomerase
MEQEMTFLFRAHRTAPLLWAAATLLAACGGNGVEETASLEGEGLDPIAAPAGTEWTDQVTVTEYDGYLVGNPDAPIKVVEYASLTCPACAQFAAEGAGPLKEDYVSTGRVSFELRNQIHGPQDLVLARLVRCAPEEAFHPLSDQVWANLEPLLGPLYQNPGPFQQALSLPEEQRFVAAAEAAGFYDFFAQRGLSEARARECLADFSSLERIAENSQTQSEELGVTGTPTFFVNGQRVDANRWSALEPVLQRAGAR